MGAPCVQLESVSLSVVARYNVKGVVCRDTEMTDKFMRHVKLNY